MEKSRTSFAEKLKEKADALKRELYALYLAAKHPLTPWYAKLWLLIIVGYAISPIDLIPDFIPVLGLLDDIILLPLGIWLALKMIPKNVMDECRLKSADSKISSKAQWVISAIIVFIWLVVIFWISNFIFYKYIVEL